MTSAMPLRIVRGERGADSDESLVEALRRGEPRAELEAWNRFSPRVDATLRRLLGPGEDPVVARRPHARGLHAIL